MIINVKISTNRICDRHCWLLGCKETIVHHQIKVLIENMIHKLSILRRRSIKWIQVMLLKLIKHRDKKIIIMAVTSAFHQCLPKYSTLLWKMIKNNKKTKARKELKHRIQINRVLWCNLQLPVIGTFKMGLTECTVLTLNNLILIIKKIILEVQM